MAPGTSSRAASVALVACAIATGPGCVGWSPPPPELLQRLAAAEAPPRYTRWAVTAEVQGADAGGRLSGVLLVEHRERPRLRMQLFPDLGAKVIDLYVGPEGYASHAEDPLRRWQDGEPFRRRPIDAGPRCEMDVLALSLRRAITPLDPGAVEGVRQTAGGWRLELPDTPEGVDLEADVTADGAVTRWAFTYVSVSWTLAHDGDDLVFFGEGIRVRLARDEATHPASVPDEVLSPPSEPS